MPVFESGISYGRVKMYYSLGSAPECACVDQQKTVSNIQQIFFYCSYFTFTFSVVVIQSVIIGYLSIFVATHNPCKGEPIYNSVTNISHKPQSLLDAFSVLNIKMTRYYSPSTYNICLTFCIYGSCMLMMVCKCVNVNV